MVGVMGSQRWVIPSNRTVRSSYEFKSAICIGSDKPREPNECIGEIRPIAIFRQ